MDDLDHTLIRLLRSNARLSISSLAAATSASRATVRARIDRLVRSNIISGFTIQLGSQSRDAGVRALVMIEVRGRLADQVSERLLGLPEVRTLHSTNGRWDLVVEIESLDLAEFDQVLREIRQIDGIESTETSIMLASRRRHSD